ncbi:MAG: cysteine desulfurase [Rhodoglobus sp.]|nr:cysteine desulfurase [Rhodoglobus sp.]
MIYLDSAATTAVRREVLEAMWPYLTGDFGNPSSRHELGEAAAIALQDARAALARWFGCRASEVVFTSGGTEADNLAVKGIALADPRGRHVVTTAIEHEAVLESCAYLERHHGFEVTVVGVDTEGLVDVAEFTAALRPDTTLVSVMYANNEVGAIQPVAELAAAARALGIRVHTDAVQAAGWLDLTALDVDAISISGHKLGAPKGIGALYVRGGTPLEPVLHGGGQERGRRSGTENVAGAVGLAAALALAPGGDIAPLRDAFIDEVLAIVPGAVLTGPRDRRLPSNASFCFPGTSGESILLELGRRGIVVSAGSACAAGSDEPSHVLLAMGIAPEVAQTAVRFSLDATATAEQLHAVALDVAAASESVATLGQATARQA